MKNITVWGNSLPAKAMYMELLLMRNHSRAVRSLISVPMEYTVIMNIISMSTPGTNVLHRYTE